MAPLESSSTLTHITNRMGGICHSRQIYPSWKQQNEPPLSSTQDPVIEAHRPVEAASDENMILRYVPVTTWGSRGFHLDSEKRAKAFSCLDEKSIGETLERV